MSIHLTEEVVSDYVESRISAGDRDIADRHTVDCDACMDHIVAAALSLDINRRISNLLFDDGGDS